jgi:hypothetical protein
MAGQIFEMHPVSRMTIEAIGPPGQRVFLLQASQGTETLTLKLEKEQAQVLAHSIDQLLEELSERFPRPISTMDPKTPWYWSYRSWRRKRNLTTPGLLVSGPRGARCRLLAATPLR